MYQKAQVRGRRLCSGVTGACLLLLFAIDHAKAGPLAPAHVVGQLFLNLTPPDPIAFDDFGVYSLLQSAGALGDSAMYFTAFGTPAPSLAGRIGIGGNSLW